jgi:putative transposase
LFQERLKGILVDKEPCLLALIRHIVFNPACVKRVHLSADWRWSGYCVMVGRVDAPAWLETDALLAQFSNQFGRLGRVTCPFRD